jgi:hypothetical protein
MQSNYQAMLSFITAAVQKSWTRYMALCFTAPARIPSNIDRIP